MRCNGAERSPSSRSGVMLPMDDYDTAAKMADGDVTSGGGDVPRVVDECGGRATADICRRGRRPYPAPYDDGAGRKLMRPDGTPASCRRLGRGVAFVAAANVFDQNSTETMSTAPLPCDRTLLGSVDLQRRTSYTSPNGRFTGVGGGGRIWQTRAGANSILRRSVSVVLQRRRHQYARSRRRLVSVAGGGGTVLMASLLAAALLVGCAVADPRHFHGESLHTGAWRGRQPAPAASSDGRGIPPRRSRSDNVGAGTPCIYEGHIKTDR